MIFPNLKKKKSCQNRKFIHFLKILIQEIEELFLKNNYEDNYLFWNKYSNLNIEKQKNKFEKQLYETNFLKINTIKNF